MLSKDQCLDLLQGKSITEIWSLLNNVNSSTREDVILHMRPVMLFSIFTQLDDSKLSHILLLRLTRRIIFPYMYRDKISFIFGIVGSQMRRTPKNTITSTFNNLLSRSQYFPDNINYMSSLRAEL